MNAQRLTNGEPDVLLYSQPITNPARLLPARCPLPMKPMPKRVNRKTAGVNGLMVSFNGVSVLVERDEDLPRAFDQLIIPCKATAPAPIEVLPAPDSKPLPIDEKPAPVGFCLNWETAKLDGLLAMHKFTARTKLRIPMGQRVLSPLHCRWSSVQQDFVYSFAITEGQTKWYVESELVEVKE